jgi:hypothetical protein
MNIYDARQGPLRNGNPAGNPNASARTVRGCRDENMRWPSGTIDDTGLKAKVARAREALLCTQKPIHPETEATATPAPDLPGGVGLPPAPVAAPEWRMNDVHRSPCTVRRRSRRRRPRPCVIPAQAGINRGTDANCTAPAHTAPMAREPHNGVGHPSGVP